VAVAVAVAEAVPGIAGGIEEESLIQRILKLYRVAVKFLWEK
jgi:hypothetical protein